MYTHHIQDWSYGLNKNFTIRFHPEQVDLQPSYPTAQTLIRLLY